MLFHRPSLFACQIPNTTEKYKMMNKFHSKKQLGQFKKKLMSHQLRSTENLQLQNVKST